MKIDISTSATSPAESRSDSPRWRPVWLLLIPLLLLVTWLGARALNADALWYDEERSLYDSGAAGYGPLSPVEIWQRVATRNPWHTPGYFILLNQWGTVAGWTPFAGRAFSLLVGLLAVAMTYRAGADLFSRRVGLNAAIVLSGSAFFVYYLHELRLYTLYALLTPLALWLYWRVISQKHDLPTQIGFVLGVIGLLYTHYFASLVLGGIALYHLLFVPKDRAWWRVVILMGLGGASFLPWFGNVWGVVTSVAGGDSANAMLLPNHELVPLVIYALGNGFTLVWLLPLAFALPALRTERALRLLLVAALSVLLLALIVNAITAVIPNIRYLMGLFPLAALITAYGVERLARYRYLRPFFLSFWLAIGIFHSFNPVFNDLLYGERFRDFFRPYLRWDVLAETIHEGVQTGDAVAFSAPIHAWTVGSVFEYYMAWLPVRYTMMDWIPGEQDGDEYYGQARRFLAERLRVWVGEEHNGAPDFRLAEFERALTDEGFTSCGTIFDDSDMSLRLYARVDHCCFPPDDVAAAARMQFGDGIHLTYASAEAADDSLAVILAWSQSESVPRSTYSTALHLLDSDGALVAQADVGLPLDDFTCQAASLPLPAGLPAGEYDLMTTVYNWSSGERLPAIAADGAQGDRLLLEQIVIGN